MLPFRKECETVASALTQARIHAQAYHAGLNDKERTLVQDLWMNDRCKVNYAGKTLKNGIRPGKAKKILEFSNFK